MSDEVQPRPSYVTDEADLLHDVRDRLDAALYALDALTHAVYATRPSNGGPPAYAVGPRAPYPHPFVADRDGLCRGCGGQPSDSRHSRGCGRTVDECRACLRQDCPPTFDATTYGDQAAGRTRVFPGAGTPGHPRPVSFSPPGPIPADSSETSTDRNEPWNCPAAAYVSGERRRCREQKRPHSLHDFSAEVPS